MKAFDREALEHLAFNIRRDIVATIATNGEGHVGGALSATDIVAVLYGAIMNYDPQDPLHRDKLILSAGHKCLTLYGAMAELGVIDKAELKTYNQLGTRFPGHPDATKLPCFDFSTGSLGHGLPLGCGYAMAAKLQGDSYRTYVIMGDGEQGEGSSGRPPPLPPTRSWTIWWPFWTRTPFRSTAAPAMSASPRTSRGATPPSAGPSAPWTAMTWARCTTRWRRSPSRRASPPLSWPRPPRARVSPSWRIRQSITTGTRTGRTPIGLWRNWTPLRQKEGGRHERSQKSI